MLRLPTLAEQVEAAAICDKTIAAERQQDSQRGNGKPPAAAHKPATRIPKPKRTHCSKGHCYATDGFTVSKRDGARLCRPCQTEAKRDQRAKQHNNQKGKS